MFTQVKAALFIAMSSLGIALFNEVVSAGTLTCTITTSCPSGVVLFRMSDTTNAHAGLADQSNYTQLVCCSGVTGLTNTCTGTHATVAKLSGATNAHIEQNTESNYENNVCLGVGVGGSVSVGYQTATCLGYDTTIASFSDITNAHVGSGLAYSKKICATAAGSSGTLSVDIVDASSVSVVSPSLTMAAASFSFPAQTITGTFGTASQKIRVSNSTGNAQWSLTLAPTDGATALWSDGSRYYDLNDPTASAVDGGDSDSYGGQISLDASSGTITPQSGCTNTGVTLGLGTSLSEGSIDSITLLSGGASAETNCYWDLTGIDVSQSIPAEQPASNYTLNMTLTITAI